MGLRVWQLTGCRGPLHVRDDEEPDVERAPWRPDVRCERCGGDHSTHRCSRRDVVSPWVEPPLGDQRVTRPLRERVVSASNG